MKNLIKILAVVGTGVVIGTVAGKFLKIERKQVGKFIRDVVNENNFSVRSIEKLNQDDLELYFI
jgi:hypothetical protein